VNSSSSSVSAPVLWGVAHPGTRLDYHIKFISAAEDCLPKIDSESRAQSLRNAAQAKRDSIPEALWNGIWGASEMERFFSRSGEPCPQSRTLRCFGTPGPG